MAAGPERHGSPSEPRLVSSGGAPTAQPQNEYFTYLTAYRSPTATRACAVPVLAVVTLSSRPPGWPLGAVAAETPLVQ